MSVLVSNTTTVGTTMKSTQELNLLDLAKHIQMSYSIFMEHGAIQTLLLTHNIVFEAINQVKMSTP